MRFYHLLFIVSLITFSCLESRKHIINRKIITPEEQIMLIGRQNKKVFLTEGLSSWYLTEYDAYEPNTLLLKKLRRKMRGYRFEIFMATWSDESKTQFPRFIKTLDELKIPQARYKIYAMNKRKESFYGEENQKNIQYAPTIIIYRYEKEINRIVETPINTFEEDLYQIVTGEDYTPKHSF